MNYFVILAIYLFILVLFIHFGINSKLFTLKNKITSLQYSIIVIVLVSFLLVTILFIEITFSSLHLTTPFAESIKKTINSLVLFVLLFYFVLQSFKHLFETKSFKETMNIINPIDIFQFTQILKANVILVDSTTSDNPYSINENIKKIGELKYKIAEMNDFDLYALNTYLKVVLTKEKLLYNGFVIALFSLIGGYLLNQTTIISNNFGLGFLSSIIGILSIFLYYANILNKNLFLLGTIVEDIIREKE